MPSALTFAALFLLPVVALLFIALRRRRRVEYPHDLLAPKADKPASTALWRSLRLYYDAVLDAAAALALGVAVAGFPLGRTDGDAIVIDASLSMLRGLRGDRPLDEAARLALGGELGERLERGATLFVLGRDPVRLTPRLKRLPWSEDDDGGPLELARRLEGSEAFLSVDYGLVAGLARKGYGRVTLITDDESLSGAGVEIGLVEGGPFRSVYPASAAWDSAGRPIVRLAASGGAQPEALWELRPDGSLARAKPEDYAIVPHRAGAELRFEKAGIWAIEWDGRLLPFRAPPRPLPLSAGGAFAGAVAEALGAPVAAMADAPGPGIDLNDGGGRARDGKLSVTRSAGDGYALAPALVFGAAVAAGFDEESDLALSEASLAAPETAFAFYTAWLAGAEAVAVSSEEAVSGEPGRASRVGEGFVCRRGDARLVVLAPPSEYHARGRPLVVEAGERYRPRLALAAVLALLYGLKLALGRLYRSSRRSGNPGRA